MCVGRLDAQKGAAWLLETMPAVFARLPEHDLLLVGEGPLRDELERLAARLGIAPKVHFAGQRSDVPDLLTAADLLVLPSRWEGMPNVVLEAMAAGLPIVATDVEGVREAVAAGAAEQVVATNDPQAFSERIVAILSDAALAERIANENHRRHRQDLDLNEMVRAYERLYHTLLAAGA